MSTAEHPQTNGQAETTVKIIQKMLRPFVFQGQDWEGLLSTLEFVKIPYIIVWTGAILQLKSDFLNYYILMNNFFYNLINISLKS